MSDQIVIWLFSIKKVWTFLNSWIAIRPYTSYSAAHTQMQTESEALKTHALRKYFMVIGGS